MIKFSYVKINRPKLDSSNENHKKLSDTFDLLEVYKDKIKSYIYTDINILYDSDDKRFIVSRVQQILSSTLLRSLYIRNGIVDAINSRNLVSLFANLKSFMEVPALLMYLNSLIEQDLSTDEYLEKFSDIVFGNRGDSELNVGERKAVNILTMFEKIEKHMKKISNPKNVKDVDKKTSKVMTDFYTLVCNASHPNYDAHDMIGYLDDQRGLWIGLSVEDFKKRMVDDALWYTPPVTITITMIEYICKLISGQKKINNFNNLPSLKYLEQ